MRSKECEGIQEVLPDWVAGILDPKHDPGILEHLSSCSECREEEKVVRSLFEGRPEAPEGLESRIQDRILRELGGPASAPERDGQVVALPLGRRWAPTWALSAAALVILSLGIGVIWDGENPEVQMDPLEVAVEEPLPEEWLWDDGIVAGAPVFDGLTDEELEALIQELEG
jgi:hypothetical protein